MTIILVAAAVAVVAYGLVVVFQSKPVELFDDDECHK